VAISASVAGPCDATPPGAAVDKGLGLDAIPDVNVPLTVNSASLMIMAPGKGSADGRGSGTKIEIGFRPL
jgi:hypothetical protein